MQNGGKDMCGKKCKMVTAPLLFMLAVSLTLGGCSLSKESSNQKKDGKLQGESLEKGGAVNEPVNMVSEDGSWLGEGGCYKQSALELAEYNHDIAVYGDEIYTRNMDLSTEEVVERICRGEETIYENCGNVDTMSVADSGIWIVADVTDYKNYGAGDIRQYQLKQIGFDGREILTKDITGQIQDSFCRDMRIDGEGRLLLLMEREILVYNREGAFVGSIQLEETGKNLVMGGDGRPCVVTGSRTKNEGTFVAAGEGMGGQVMWLDLADMMAKPLTEYDGYRICDGGEEFLFLLLNKDGLYKVPDAEKNPVPVAVWSELGMTFYEPKSVFPMKEGQFLIWDRNLAAVLSPADPGEIKPKNVITVASVSPWSSGLNGVVSDFNLKSPEYLIKIIDYSQNGELPLVDAFRSFNMDIMAGKYPDLLYMIGIPESYYTDKGLLQNIYDCMEKDPEIEPEDFILLDKLETDGKLFYVTDHFYLETAAGLESRFGDKAGISLEDYLNLQKENSGEIMYNVTRENFLNTQVYQYAANAVDWEAGTCDFESEDFIKILNAVRQVRENPEPLNPSELNYTPAGKRLAEGSLILSYWFVDGVKSLAEAEAEAGQPLNFVGLPTPDGIGGTRIQTNGSLAICSKGQKEGAWEFTKYFLTEGAEKSAAYGITVNKAILEKQIHDALADKEDIPFGEEDVKQLYDFLDRGVYYGTASSEVVNIVMEEAAAFLEGAKTAEDTAHIIQSRVGILVTE